MKLTAAVPLLFIAASSVHAATAQPNQDGSLTLQSVEEAFFGGFNLAIEKATRAAADLGLSPKEVAEAQAILDKFRPNVITVLIALKQYVDKSVASLIGILQTKF
ncbi:hypothetical protein BX661DRAFT_176166 [Kickxella alabastrina]|uniref:uncharacterized protein n=1 Tax=Kickxella alabastrina TaxID=61397 RepID=UPI00221FCC79|nr:uncharacterized protein BX661DRAFT_176166 [Kickxella alabastrina]KAI7835147.1 hypothetical protein BX661DRAFT_176166 [Kickxella alabastrina]